MKFGLGHLPDLPKAKGQKADFDFDRLGLSAGPPDKASARHLVASVLNQKSLGSCVAHAGFQAIRASHIKQFVEEGSPLLEAQARARLGSRLAGYFFARAANHVSKYDSGTHMRSFFEVLNTFGFCSEEHWPYTDDGRGARLVNGIWQFDDELDPLRFAPFLQMPNTAAIDAGFDQRSPTLYHRIFDTGYDRVDAIKAAVANEYLVVFGTNVSQKIFGWIAGDSPLDPPVGETIQGGHAMTIAEYDEESPWIVNSWGSGYGDEGWLRLSWDYIAWDETRDLWIVENAPLYS